MTPTTLVMAYYENPGMLAKQFASIRELPANLRDLIGVVIVDDGSPTKPAQPEDLAGVPLQIYRIGVDVRWNQDAARNIGVAHAENNWLCLTDIDHMVPQRTWEAMVLRNHDKENVYNYARVSAPEMQPYKTHPNSWFMHRDMFERCGGYDERFAGYYGTDGDFKDRVVQNAAKIKMFKEFIIRVPRTVLADASTTTYLRKQPEDKPMIIQIKANRNKEKDWKPLRGSFPYVRVHP
jgi:hypothetical protein